MKLWTHSGEYHADDIISTVILRELFPKAVIVRDRNVTQQELEDPNVLLYDVGGVYDPALNNFDHHIPGGVPSRDGYLYSSLGLIWSNYASRFLISILEGSSSPEDLFPYISECRKYLDGNRSPIAEAIRKTMIVPIDKWDNGVYPANRFLAISEQVQSMRDDDVPFRRAVEVAKVSVMAYVRATLFRMLREHLVREGIAYSEIAPNVYVSKVHVRSLGPLAATESPTRRLMHPVVKNGKINSYVVYHGREKASFKSWKRAQEALHHKLNEYNDTNSSNNTTADPYDNTRD
jgi:uncharacterized UPF0160 family protein